MTIHITSKEHLEQELSQTPVAVIDFYADWCGPCQMIAPFMEELASENAEKGVKVLKVNTDENGVLAEEFGVSSIPVVFFAKNGEVKEGFMGANPKNFYQEKIDAYIAENA